MSYEDLTLERHDSVALITFNRPEKLNAIGAVLRREQLEAIEEVRNDDAVRAVVFTGAGRGFCSGADLTGGAGAGGDRPAPSQNQLLDEFSWVGAQAKAVYGLDKPTIAAMNGVAAGAGMSFSLACDLRVGSENARFKTVFIERNLSPDSGMSFFLPRIVGYSRAADLIFTSRSCDAEEAYRMGLLDRLVPHDELIDRSLELASQMAAWPPLALRAGKRVLQHNIEVELDEALRYEIVGLSHARKAVNDAKESRASFVEKRAPKFTGT